LDYRDSFGLRLRRKSDAAIKSVIPVRMASGRASTAGTQVADDAAAAAAPVRPTPHTTSNVPIRCFMTSSYWRLNTRVTSFAVGVRATAVVG
jgi:hypothetical protein